MPLETIHNVDKGVSRLYTAPDDLESIPPHGRALAFEQASAEHRRLFAAYVADFAEVYDVAAEWWSSLVDAQMPEAGSREEAVEMAFDRRLAGPAAAPEVVSLVRSIWLECAAINAARPEAERVPPQVLLLGWLVETGRRDFVQLLTCMPYWPIGLDENGNWC